MRRSSRAGWASPASPGCEGLEIEAGTGVVTIGGHELHEGDVITIDGSTGRVMIGKRRLVPPAIDENFGTILDWADELRRLGVRANADTPEDAAKAREFGAEGIGLCRTEHMFMAADRLPIVQEMIMARDEASVARALDRLLPVQQSDFEGIFEAMAGLPVIIRLLDPPLHEFLPSLEEATSEEMRASDRAAAGGEPDAGHARLPARARVPGDLRDAGARDRARGEGGARPDRARRRSSRSCIPLVGFEEELRRLRELTERVAAEEPTVDYLCGTMIELPRACVRADDIARDRRLLLLRHERPHADDARLLARRRRGQVPHRSTSSSEILERNPFETIDQEGVGELMRIAVERGRGVKPELKLGICGEHGGEPRSVAFCHRLGLDYVSCSPYRVPLARLAAAQAALAERGVTAVADRRLEPKRPMRHYSRMWRTRR